ncbi:hypothetical protein HD841_003452 [Sphingomonas melonis]|uniref:Uncharacterized protein n=2 Tax=Sphingomonas melonis TaxID=152682 RepID=A0A7Y9FSU5_9SPHN|nr:hypothetical protein [Sphingomonas melonis]
MDLSVPPEDPVEAEGYVELYRHLQQLFAALGGRRLSEEDFAKWDADVKKLLRASELPRYEKPLRPHIPLSSDTIQYARNFHLTKILWARKGLEKLMTDTGY